MSPDPVAHEVAVEQFFVTEEPYYHPVGSEVELFEAANVNRMPVLLKGPTGCGKTRFVEYMAWRLSQDRGRQIPLITVACHEDISASDLVGRYVLRGGDTEWLDGPLTRAVKAGGICYLDEIVESRSDTTVLIHPLTDHRRILPIDRQGKILNAHEDFTLIISYNPGYQSILKDLKQSTRQRFVAMSFDYPDEEIESRIIQREAGVDPATAKMLAAMAIRIRHLKEHGLEEGVSTRLLVYAAVLMNQGVSPRQACEAAIAEPLSDDPEMNRAIREVIYAVAPDPAE